MALPRLSAQQPIVTTGGKPSSPFLEFMEQARKAQEATDATQNTTLEAIEAQQAIIETQQEQILEALQLANIAIGLTGGNAGVETLTMDIIGTAWQAGPQVDLTGVVAGDLTVPGSGLFADAGTDQNLATVSGQVRLVEIDGGDTVIGGPWAFDSTKDAIFGTVFCNNTEQLNIFLATLTTTGAISYRLDFRLNTPGWEITDVPARLYARRTT